MDIHKNARLSFRENPKTRGQTGRSTTLRHDDDPSNNRWRRDLLSITNDGIRD